MSPTLILVILNIGASLYAWNNQEIYPKWLMTPYKVNRENQYYRFITSGVIHGDWMHLAFNMIALYSFGRNLEYYLAGYVGMSYQLYYFAMYLVALIVSEIPTYFKHKNNSAYHSLGASGAVSAVIFACVIISPLNELLVFFIPMPGFIFGVVFGILFIVLLNPSVVPDFFYQISQWRLFQ